MTRSNSLPLAAVLALGFPSIAHAALPEAVERMIAEAEKTGDSKKLATVYEVARAAYPEDGAQLDALEARSKTLLANRKERDEKAALAERRQAGFFDLWKGKGELGALRSTGNSSDIGVTAALSLTRRGVDWRHKLRSRIDYQRSDGETTREQYLLAYEPSYDLADRTYVYGLTQYERDRFQGFSARYSLSGGIGYRVFDREDLSLSIKAGPAYRRTTFVGDGSESYIAGLAGLDFDWQFAENLSLTETASAFVQSDNSTFSSLTGIEAGIGTGLKARLSYTLEYETDPPAGAVKTDTLSRFTIIYDF